MRCAIALLAATTTGCDLILDLDARDSSPTPSPITFVQANVNAPEGPAATITTAFLSSQSAGNVNVVVVGWLSHKPITAFEDTVGNTYRLAASMTSSIGASQAIYYSSSIKAATQSENSVRVSFEDFTRADVKILEYSGLLSDEPFDVGASIVGSGSSLASNEVTTTHANVLLVSAAITCDPTTLTADAPFKSRLTSQRSIVADAKVTELDTYKATATQTGVSCWVMQLVTLKGQ